MTYDEFEARASELWDEVPPEYKQGVDGLIVERGAKAHPEMPDVYTLGECVTEAYPSDYGGPDNVRSAVLLHYGSFFRLSRIDEAFDWEEELWETITHELRHHLESLAAEDALEDVDYAVDENFKRVEGEPFDPEFYRSGEPVGPNLWRVEREYFLELPAPQAESLRFAWEGREWVAPVPAHTGDVSFLEVVAGPEPDEGGILTLVIVRPRSFGSVVRDLFRRRTLDVQEYQVEATPAQ